MMSVPRILLASLVSCLAIAYIGGNAQTLPADAAAMASSGFLFSVDVFLGESESPLVLGIRHGQTVAQAAVGFCHEQGWDEESQTRLVPRLIEVLEEGIAEELGQNVPVRDDALSPSLVAGEHEDPDHENERTHDLALDDPVLTLGVSLGGENERMLHYYAGQDPVHVAMTFCAENLLSSTPEEFARCSDALSAHLAESLSAAGSVAMDDTRSEQQQQQEGGQQVQERKPQEQEVASSVRQPLITVPLNINGIETVLQIFRESHAVEMASELCRREEFGLEEASMTSCLAQITEIAHRAITAYNKHDGEQRSQVEADPFTFKVPVTLAGLQLHAEFMTSETPRASALRFCTPNLRKIESALGLVMNEDEGEGMDASKEGRSMSEGRESLREACTVVVEDAINAVLLGLRERVMEAEMAQANATDSRHNENSRWSQEEGVEADVWAASQVVADTMV